MLRGNEIFGVVEVMQHFAFHQERAFDTFVAHAFFKVTRPYPKTGYGLVLWQASVVLSYLAPQNLMLNGFLFVATSYIAIIYLHLNCHPINFRCCPHAIFIIAIPLPDSGECSEIGNAGWLAPLIG